MGRRKGELARNDPAQYDLALGFPCVLTCTRAIALLAHLFEAFLQLGDALLGKRQLVGGERVGVGVLASRLDGAENAGPVRAGHGGSLGEIEHGGACPVRYGGWQQGGTKSLNKRLPERQMMSPRGRLARPSCGT